MQWTWVAAAAGGAGSSELTLSFDGVMAKEGARLLSSVRGADGSLMELRWGDGEAWARGAAAAPRPSDAGRSADAMLLDDAARKALKAVVDGVVAADAQVAKQIGSARRCAGGGWAARSTTGTAAAPAPGFAIAVTFSVAFSVALRQGFFVIHGVGVIVTSAAAEGAAGWGGGSSSAAAAKMVAARIVVDSPSPPRYRPDVVGMARRSKAFRRDAMLWTERWRAERRAAQRRRLARPAGASAGVQHWVHWVDRGLTGEVRPLRIEDGLRSVRIHPAGRFDFDLVRCFRAALAAPTAGAP
eukprot:gene1508-3065_t